MQNINRQQLIKIGSKLIKVLPNTAAEFEQMLGNIENETQLLGCMIFMRASNPGLRKIANDAFEGYCYFFVDSKLPQLKQMATLAKRKLERTELSESLLNSHNGDLTGVELCSENGNGLVFLPDASEPGKFRVSFYDSRGFYGHRTRDTYKELCDEVHKEGFYMRESRLQDYSLKKEWAQGSLQTCLIQQLNAKQITWCEYIEQMKSAA